MRLMHSPVSRLAICLPRCHMLRLRRPWIPPFELVLLRQIFPETSQVRFRQGRLGRQANMLTAKLIGEGFSRPNADSELPIDINYAKVNEWLVSDGGTRDHSVFWRPSKLLGTLYFTNDIQGTGD